MNISNLTTCFELAKKRGAKYVAILVGMEGFEKPEVIINDFANIDDKLDYYKRTYDEKLIHRFSKTIKIIGFTFGDSFQEIQDNLEL